MNQSSLFSCLNSILNLGYRAYLDYADNEDQKQRIENEYQFSLATKSYSQFTGFSIVKIEYDRHTWRTIHLIDGGTRYAFMHDCDFSFQTGIIKEGTITRSNLTTICKENYVEFNALAKLIKYRCIKSRYPLIYVDKSIEEDVRSSRLLLKDTLSDPKSYIDIL